MEVVIAPYVVINTKGIEFWLSLGYGIISEPELQYDTTIVLHMRKYI